MKNTLAFLIACSLGMSAFSGTPIPAVVAKPTVPPDSDPAVPAVATSIPAETNTDGPEKIIARFFSYLERREVDQAYDQLTRGTKIADRADDVRTLKSKTKEAITVFGPVLGFDTVVKKNVGARLVSYTLLSLGKEFPLRWRFYFYKPQETWKLIDLRVDDRLAAMFDETDEGRPREERP